METLPADWLSLLTLTFVLGMKHGFDADHLATIDGLTRYTRVRQFASKNRTPIFHSTTPVFMRVSGRISGNACSGMFGLLK